MSLLASTWPNTSMVICSHLNLEVSPKLGHGIAMSFSMTMRVWMSVLIVSMTRRFLWEAHVWQQLLHPCSYIWSHSPGDNQRIMQEALQTSLSGCRSMFKHPELFAQSLLHWETWSCIINTAVKLSTFQGKYFWPFTFFSGVEPPAPPQQKQS